MTAYPITADSKFSDLSERALARRIDEYKNDDDFASLVSSYVEELQAIENDTWSVIVDRLLENAEGVQLDVLGRIVGEPRYSDDDDEYRFGIRARIAVNLSQGLRSDIYLVSTMVLYSSGVPADFVITERYPCSVFIEALDVIDYTISRVMGYLRQTRAGGVRLHLIYPTYPTTDSFIWSDNDTSVDSNQGWADALNIDLFGGYFSGVIA